MGKVLRGVVALALVATGAWFAFDGPTLAARALAALAGVPPWLPVAAVALVLLSALARRAAGRGSGQSDPVRMYPAAVRAEVFARAGGQCEYTGWAWQRCRAKAEHADHVIPWSKGGATSLQNGAASCAHHNTSKGAKLLTRGQLRGLERRRRRYFPPGVPVKAGQLYGEPAVTAPALQAPQTRRPAADLRPVQPTATESLPPAPAAPRSWERQTPTW